MFQLAGLVPLLPWLAAAWIGLGLALDRYQYEARERETARLALGTASLSLALALGLGLLALWRGPPGQVGLGTWLASGEYRVDLSLGLDPLGLALMNLVALVGWFGLRFSVPYMHRETGFHRFLMGLCLFLGAMQLIVLGGNGVLVFMGWELAGVASYLLIAHAHERPTAADNATWVFVTNRIGDAGFLLGIALAFLWLGSSEWPTLADRAAQLDPLRADILALAFLLAALVKSAQVPFSAWIQRALEGPTPSSALFYGSLMVHAGVYLLIRLAPVLAQAPAVLWLMALVGLLTCLYGWLTGLVQSDAKSALLAATLAQVGLMVFWCGLGWTELAAWHLGLHALWRAYQFLHAPALLHLLQRPARPAPAWLARSRWLHGACLQRFWLDALGNWLLARPSMALARDIQYFDERVVSRAMGLPGQATAMAALDADKDGAHVGWGRGLLGRLLDRLATLLHWFEERLVLHGGGEGLLSALRRVGAQATRVEHLLSQPRYLLLIIMLTFVVIL